MGRANTVPRELIEKLRIFAKRLVEANLGLRAVILFGSYARGDWLRDSDVDVLIVAEGFRNRPFYEREYMVSRFWSFEYALEPWCYTPEELEEVLRGRPRINVVDALENGIVVYDDGFWERVKSRYSTRPCRMTWYGGIALEDHGCGAQC